MANMDSLYHIYNTFSKAQADAKIKEIYPNYDSSHVEVFKSLFDNVGDGRYTINYYPGKGHVADRLMLLNYTSEMITFSNNHYIFTTFSKSEADEKIKEINEFYDPSQTEFFDALFKPASTRGRYIRRYKPEVCPFVDLLYSPITFKWDVPQCNKMMANLILA